MSETLMLIGAGKMQVPAIREAQQMGLSTVVLDYNPDAPGMALADYPIEMSTRDFEGCVRVANDFQQEEINGVITVGTDASLSQAAVSEALGLTGIKFTVAERATNKVKMREQFQKYGLPQPKFRAIWSLEEARQVAEDLGYPLVIKPADNMGGRGVRKIEDEDDLEPGFNHAKSLSPRGEVIAEEFLPGPEYSTDSLFYDGELVHQVVADRIIDHPPYFIETGHVLPSQEDKETQEKILGAARDAAEALGINYGAAKGDIKMTPEGPVILEMAARLSGGFMSGYTYPLATERSIIRDAIEIALGEKPDCPLTPACERVAMETAVLPSPGEIRNISGHEKLLETEGIEEIFLNSEVGDRVVEPQSNLDKPANVIVTGAHYKIARQRAQEASETLEFEMGPPPELTWGEIEDRARARFQGSCAVCDICDGRSCAGEVPGVGGVGRGETFRENLRALERWKINTRCIQENGAPELKQKLWGYNLELPVLAAPITGTTTNMNGALPEKQYARAVIDGCREAGTIGMVGDGATTNKYKIGLEAVEKAEGWGIPIFKPRLNPNEVQKRLQLAAKSGARATGIDIDSITHECMALRSQRTRGYGEETLKELAESTELDLILKGIMSPKDAEKAVACGADGIIVSNHGGRVLDQQPGSAEVLPEIASTVGNKLPLLVDGGIRSGLDVFKCLALGADAVLIGRPIMIAAVGAEHVGVKFYLNKIREELLQVCMMTDVTKLEEINDSLLRLSGES